MCEGSFSICEELCDCPLWLEFTAGAVITELGNQNAVGIVGSQDEGGQVATLNHQLQGWHGYRNGQ